MPSQPSQSKPACSWAASAIEQLSSSRKPSLQPAQTHRMPPSCSAAYVRPYLWGLYFTLFSVARCSANKDISASTLSYQVRHPADGAVHSLAVCAGDLSKALHASSRYLEACNSRSRLELLIASPGISMDLQDRLLDLADAMSTLRGCQLQVRL